MDDDVKRRCEEALRQSEKTLAAADQLLARLLAVYGKRSDGREPAPPGDPTETTKSKTRRRT
jgi:hypothetical protein